MWSRPIGSRGRVRPHVAGSVLTDRSLVEIYRRPDAFYLIHHDRTTTGSWLYPPSAPMMLTIETRPNVLGSRALHLLSTPTRVVEHPANDEWTATWRAARLPILQQAHLRSWSQFLAGASTVSIARDGSRVTIEPMRPMAKPKDAFEPDIEHTVVLLEPDAENLGATILTSFT